jgi:RNA polymerase sigma-70 factor (ECF subfamily)
MTLHLIKPVHDADVATERTDRLDELYARHASDVKRWVRRLAGPSADVDDLLHDVFVIALRRRFTFRGEANVTTWLFRITHHVVRSRQRRSYLRALLFGRHQDALAEATTPSATPHEEVERREQHVLLYQALGRLPDAYRTALILYEIDGLSGEAVAELIGISLGTLWVRLHRGRAKLLACLSEEERP